MLFAKCQPFCSDLTLPTVSTKFMGEYCASVENGWGRRNYGMLGEPIYVYNDKTTCQFGKYLIISENSNK